MLYHNPLHHLTVIFLRSTLRQNLATFRNQTYYRRNIPHPNPSNNEAYWTYHVLQPLHEIITYDNPLGVIRFDLYIQFSIKLGSKKMSEHSSDGMQHNVAERSITYPKQKRSNKKRIIRLECRSGPPLSRCTPYVPTLEEPRPRLYLFHHCTATPVCFEARRVVGIVKKNLI